MLMMLRILMRVCCFSGDELLLIRIYLIMKWQIFHMLLVNINGEEREEPLTPRIYPNG
jgi:hypothetical protein